jgi:hypothetical protein
MSFIHLSTINNSLTIYNKILNVILINYFNLVQKLQLAHHEFFSFLTTQQLLIKRIFLMMRQNIILFKFLVSLFLGQLIYVVHIKFT